MTEDQEDRAMAVPEGKDRVMAVPEAMARATVDLPDVDPAEQRVADPMVVARMVADLVANGDLMVLPVDPAQDQADLVGVRADPMVLAVGDRGVAGQAVFRGDLVAAPADRTDFLVAQAAVDHVGLVDQADLVEISTSVWMRSIASSIKCSAKSKN